MDSPLQAPPVVAVVVTCDPGPWLEEALRALAAQDYPNLSVLVVDANSDTDPTSRVAAILPGAYVRRLATNAGFGASANSVMEVVEGASHLLFCHDDVAPEPDAVRLMVEEGFRSNAGVVTPKFVDWHDPSRILAAGLGADKSGAPVLLVERGELDQEQHDSVRDVFVAPGGCTLVRADLFASLGGFDPVMRLFGEDLDLSWRSQIAGARVVVAPSARVRHLEALSSGRRSPYGGTPPADLADLRRQVRPLQLRHRLRAVLKCYGRWHLIRVLPQVAVLAVAEVVFGVLTGHTRTARDTASAWSWNLGRVGELRRARRRVRQTRRVSDGEVRRLQTRGSARVAGFIRGQLATERIRGHAAGALRRPRASEAGDEPDSIRVPLVIGSALTLVMLVGSRHLITGRVPAVHQLAPFPEGVAGFLEPFLSGWRQTGLGASGPAPTAFGLLGVAGLFLGGAGGLLRTLLVLGALPVGAVGAFRLARPLGSARARLAALVVYVAVPLPYNALASGRLSGLVAYASAPWLLARLLRATGVEPFGEGGDRAHTVRQVLGLGILLAVLAALEPSIVVVAPLAAAGITLGALLGGDVAATVRSLPVALAGAGVGLVLLFPWSLGFFLPGAELSAFTGVGLPPERAYGLGALLRFQTGWLGAPPIGWAFLVAAALPLLLGKGWRLGWAARLWGLALTCWALAWAGGRGWLPVSSPPADVLLAPAAAALALTVALGMAAFETDLPGYRFGWRQVASTAALVATLLGLLPVALAALGGRWRLPRQDFSGLLSWMPEQRDEGAFRVLWLGDPEALPLRSWRLDDGLGYATSRDGPPDATALWPGGSPGRTEMVADAIAVARRNGTTRLGHLLGPMAVRYVVVPLRAAPTRAKTPALPPPPDLTAALEAQMDLKQLESDDALRVYENAAWAPARARLDPEGAKASRRSGLANLRLAELAGSAPVLPTERSPTRFQGTLRRGDAVLVSESFSPRWQLRVDGEPAPRARAFGWANSFTSPASGEATLRFRTSPLHYAAVAVEVALWVVAVRALLALRRRRS
ncbi:MAG: glycosyltransferase family 2 protein [Actinomycetota bacterium]|nr:glycosyltransferase family 2 protein [Actinomycetota bacterium]